MSRNWIVLLATLCLAPPALAASGGPVKSPAWAYEFGISNATLTSFDGATLSLRRQVSPNAAWRLGLSLSMSSSKTDYDRTASNTTQYAKEHNEDGNSSATLSLARLWFPAPESVVRPWYGVGLDFGWSSDRYERTTTYYDSGGANLNLQVQSYKNRSRGPAFGASAMFGLEWNASERFAVHAQYGQSVSYRRRQTDYDEIQTYYGSESRYHREGPTNDWSTSPNSARAGVSVFW